MKNIRYGLIVLALLLGLVTTAPAQVSIGIGLPSVSIGINLPMFPELVLVPGYPVYYAPQLEANYFYYDSMYWVYQDDNWYASSWYNGPWGIVQPEVVPLFILRIPVRYYRQPPVYFSGWQSNAPPRWGQHWGHDWERHRKGWDRWKRSAVPKPAPLPAYQRQYSGDRYPRVDQQRTLRNQHYRYQPRDKVVRQHLKQHIEQKPPTPVQQRKQETRPMRTPKQPDVLRPAPLQQGAPAGPHTQPPQRGGEQVKKSAPNQAPRQQQHRPEGVREQKQQPGVAQREQRLQPSPGRHGQEQRPQESNRDHGQGQNRDDERGRGRN